MLTPSAFQLWGLLPAPSFGGQSLDPSLGEKSSMSQWPLISAFSDPLTFALRLPASHLAYTGCLRYCAYIPYPSNLRLLIWVEPFLLERKQLEPSNQGTLSSVISIWWSRHIKGLCQWQSALMSRGGSLKKCACSGLWIQESCIDCSCKS